MRRTLRTALVTACLALAAIAAGCGSDDDEAATTGGAGGGAQEQKTFGPVTLAVPVPTAFYMIPSLAKQKGLFEKQGVDVDVKYVQPGSMSPAVASGKIEYGLLPGPVPHLLQMQGADTAFVATYLHKPMLRFVTDESIGDVQDLAGKTVALGVPTSIGTIFTRKVLRDAGIEDDVKTRVIPSQEAVLQALLTGQVDAAMISTPQDLVAQKRGKKVLLDLADSDYEWPFAGIVTRKGYAAENAEQTTAIVAAIKEGAQAWKDDPETAKAIIRKEGRLTDPAQIDAAYEAVAEAVDTSAMPMAAENEAVLAEIRAGEKAPPAAKDAKAEDFFVTDYAGT